MMDDEQSQTLNMLDVMQRDSYVETISNILDISQGNEVLKDLLLRGFYQNPNRVVHHENNSLLNRLIAAGKKSEWLCEHDGCTNPSIYSHELSERAVLSYLADDNHKAFILQRNLKNNSFEFSFEDKHIRNISNFAGYCSIHDEGLFKLIDDPGREVDLEYVNLQALKMMKRHMLDHEITLKVAKNIATEINKKIDEIKGAEQIITGLQESFDIFQQAIKDMESSSEALRVFYNNLWVGIQLREYIIDYRKIPCNKTGWVFSHSFEVIEEESHERILSFIFKVDVNQQPVLIHAWDNTTLDSKHEDFYISSEKVIECMLLNKEKLVFSLGFLKTMEITHLERLLDDESIYNNVKNPVFIFLFKKIFLDELEGDLG
ncbi:hypothetical protein V9Z78_25355 [Klebsiella pneumoniae]|nr:hypothetical protein [Klebsiella pneumoniae]MCY0556627.1 hypothetical protein [Klebsiella pneumoniae]MDG0518066.1 hypothetical protein [Klebsiella pneumoniae]